MMGGVEGGVGQSEHTNIVAKKSLTLSDATDYYQYQYLGNCPPTPPPPPNINPNLSSIDCCQVRGGVGGQLPRY